MANILDYLDWRGDLPLSVSPFNEVDALILAELSFIDFDSIVPPPEVARGIPLREAAEIYFSRYGEEGAPTGALVQETVVQMLRKLSGSDRFGAMRLNGYTALLDDALEQQFAALTVELGDGSVYISFRGTDGTLVGWKEDLNLGFLDEIPSQRQAVRYLARMARQYAGSALRVGGHSKGGNLAVYSAAMSGEAVQRRILSVHNNDGPGFAFPIGETAGHQRIAARIHTVVPQSSVVGMLLEHEKHYQVVLSNNEGIYQHNGFSWQVCGTQFVHLEDSSRAGRLVDETLDAWAGTLDHAQREAIADAIYGVFTATGARTLSDLTGEKLRSAAAMLKTYKNLDRPTRRLLSETMGMLIRLGTRNLAQDARETHGAELDELRERLAEQYQRLLERRK